MLAKICVVCGNEYTTKKETQRYCSRSCRDESMKGRKNEWAIGNKWGFKKNIPAWNKGKKWSEEIKGKMSSSHVGKPVKNKGVPMSEEQKRKISESLMGRPTGRTGEKSNLWRGGRSREYDKLKNSIEWKNWRRAVFERDNYTCQKCVSKNYKGLGRTIEIHPHHIKDRKNFPELQFEVSNGQTLCVDCHRQTDNYGQKANSTT